MLADLQILPRHLIPPRDIQVRNGRELIELIADEARAPRIGNRDAHGIGVLGARGGPGKVHPVICVDVLLVPDAADLHVGVFVDEWFVFTRDFE
jgi:hypothetical protein